MTKCCPQCKLDAQCKNWNKHVQKYGGLASFGRCDVSEWAQCDVIFIRKRLFVPTYVPISGYLYLRMYK